MSVKASDTDPASECSPMKLGFFTKSDKEFSSHFQAFAETTTWCWQQGCMLQWHPDNQNSWVIYNDLVDGNYGSKVCDVNDGNKVKSYAHPVYSLDPNGRWASTLNFSRLGRLRPGYGYSLLPDETKGQLAPEDDGLFVFNLETGQKRLLVKLSDLAMDAGTPGAEHYVNHATFSPDGKRLVFFHLWATEGDKGRGLRVCEVDATTGQWREVESERTVSHYCWRDANTFLATSREQSGQWHYTLYDLESNTRKDLDLPFNEDGHPMFHPTNKNLIVTDTYPDKRRDQHLCVVDLTTKEVKEIATLYSPFAYRGQVRCDLHPRWDREGRFVVVDSTEKGIRSMVVVSY